MKVDIHNLNEELRPQFYITLDKNLDLIHLENPLVFVRQKLRYYYMCCTV